MSAQRGSGTNLAAMEPERIEAIDTTRSDRASRRRLALGEVLVALLAGGLLIAAMPATAAAQRHGTVFPNFSTPIGGGVPPTPSNAPGGATFFKDGVIGASIVLARSAGAACQSATTAPQNNCVVWHGGSRPTGTSREFHADSNCSPFGLTELTFCPTPPTRTVANSVLTVHPQINRSDFAVRPYTIDLLATGTAPKNDVRIADVTPVLTAGVTYGGNGNDTLRIQSRSRDVVFLRQGNNTVIANSDSSLGFNVIRGGRGTDQMQTVDGSKDVVSCRGLPGGPPTDIVVVDLRDEVRNLAACDRIFRAPVDQHPVVRAAGKGVPVRGGSRAAIRLACPKRATSRCKGRVRILRGKKGNKAIGRSRYSIRKGKRGTVRVRVSGTPKRVRVATRERGPDGRPKVSISQMRLVRR